MGEFKSLLLILAAIYLFECTLWVRRNAVAFVCWWGKMRLRFAGALLSNQHGGFVLINPLPPLESAFVSSQFPVSISPEAIYSYTAACLDFNWRPVQMATFFRFEEIRAIGADEKKVLVNETLFCRMPSHLAATALANWLREIGALPATQRASAIKKKLNRSFEIKEIQGRLEEFRTRTKRLSFLSNALFVYVFGLTPLIVWQFGLRHAVWGLVAGLLIQTITISILFRRAYRKFFPGSGEWFAPFLTMLLAPTLAMRARDVIARHLLEDFHPLAVAQALCRPETFRKFARGVLLDLRFPSLPVCPTNRLEAITTEEWFRTALLEEAENLIKRSGLKPESLTAAPERSESSHQSYCPRCETQFVVTEGNCLECGGRRLKSF